MRSHRAHRRSAAARLGLALAGLVSLATGCLGTEEHWVGEGRPDGAAPVIPDEEPEKEPRLPIPERDAGSPPDARRDPRLDASVPPPSGYTLPVSAYSVAQNLSRFLWNAEPDTTLVVRAAKLSTSEEVNSLALDMLNDPRSDETIARFFRTWLDLDSVAMQPPGELPREMLIAIAREPEQFGTRLVRDKETFRTLLTAPFTYASEIVAAKIYLATTPLTAARLELDPRDRAGLLTQPAFLVRTGTRQHSPAARGAFVRRRFLCQDVPPDPPARRDLELPPVPEGATTREKAELIVAQPECRGCHLVTDHVGFAFERLDGFGRVRPTENGKMVENTGYLHRADVEGPFAGPARLGDLLSRSADANRCFVRQVVGFVLDRPATQADETTVAEVYRLSGTEKVRELRAVFSRALSSRAFLLGPR